MADLSPATQAVLERYRAAIAKAGDLGLGIAPGHWFQHDPETRQVCTVCINGAVLVAALGIERADHSGTPYNRAAFFLKVDYQLIVGAVAGFDGVAKPDHLGRRSPHWIEGHQLGALLREDWSHGRLP